MQFIELNYQTWQREDCYGLFDYSETDNIKQHPSITIKATGVLYRNKVNYQLEYVPFSNKKNYQKKDQNWQMFLKICFKQGMIWVTNNQISNNPQPLCLIVPQREKGYLMKQGDKLKLGKNSLHLLRLCWTKSRTKNHYQQIIQPKLTDTPSFFATSFYSQNAQASLLQSNPSCRFCYSKTIQQKNPFLVVCNCSGFTKYIHQDCIIQWVKKRSQIQQGLKDGIYCIQAKALTCQVCNSLYKTDRLIRHVFKVQEPFLNQYAVFYVNTDPALIYVIDLGVAQQASVGRSLQCSLVINQLSVSRRHCTLSVDNQKKQLFVTDLSAKFGTIVQINQAQIQKITQLQKGRTTMRFQTKRKLSLFQKLGFCSAGEDLKNQRKHL